MKQAAKRKKPQRSCSQVKNEQRAIDVNSMAKERMNEVVQESMKRHARESVLPSTAISRGDLKPDTRTARQHNDCMLSDGYSQAARKGSYSKTQNKSTQVQDWAGPTNLHQVSV